MLGVAENVNVKPVHKGRLQSRLVGHKADDQKMSGCDETRQLDFAHAQMKSGYPICCTSFCYVLQAHKNSADDISPGELKRSR